jgi:hydroxypyruvate isomerase
MTFQLAACAEMLWRDRPIAWRASRLKEMGFGVGLWNWPNWELAALEKTGATFTIMNGYLEGRLADPAGCETLLASAKETAKIGKRLGVHRLNLHGTGLGDMGIPIPHIGAFAPGMEQCARDTLHRICDLAEAEGQVFTLENLNPIDHPGCPFGSTAAVLGLVDLYHTQIGEGDLIRWCKACLPWIGEVQVADNPGRCEPGTGEINYAGIARALKAMGYSGPVAMEANAKGDEEAALEAFRQAFTV